MSLMCLTSATVHQTDCCRGSPLVYMRIIYGCMAQLSCGLLIALACPAHAARAVTSLI